MENNHPQQNKNLTNYMEINYQKHESMHQQINPNNYYLNNPQYHHQVIPNDGRKTFTPNQINNKLFENEIYTETYYIDQKGNKVILQQENKPKANTYINKKKGVPIQNMTYPQENNTVTNSVIDDLLQSTIDDHTEKIKTNEVPNIFLPQEYKPIPSSAPTQIKDDKKKLDPKQSATLMSVMSLANVPYKDYPTAEYSKEPFFNISGYAYNSYNGKVKKYNEDRIKVIVNYKLNKYVQNMPNISYFSIFDGHSGKKCSDFLKDNLDGYLFNSKYFPQAPMNAINEAFKKAEENFKGMVYDEKSNILLDKSGSCALVMLIMNDILYSISLGDSRALYSYDGGNYLYQITRDHKPNDEIEKARIEKAGGKVFYANKVNRNGREIELKEEQFGKGFSFPYRISPGKIAVSIFFNILGCKINWRLLCKIPRTRRIYWRTYS